MFYHPFSTDSKIVPTWVKLVFGIAVGIGSTVAATYTTFETQRGHDRDLQNVQEMLREIRGDIKQLLGKPQAMKHPLGSCGGIWDGL